MSKTLHYMDRALTSGLSPKQEAEEVARLLSASCLLLDDEALFTIERVATQHQNPMVWALIEDAYGGATFSPDDAKQLSAECRTLAAEADPVAVIWLETIAAFAAAVGAQGKHLCAHAD